MQSGSKNIFVRSALMLAATVVICGSLPAIAADSEPPASPTSIQSVQDLQQWMTYYYLHPTPQLLVPALLFADSHGLVDKEKGEAPLLGFVSRVFAQNPSQIATWAGQLAPAMSSKSLPMLYTALWWSNTLEGKEVLGKLVQSLPPKSQEYLMAQMAKPAVALETMEVKSPEVLDELWGAFSATGDDKYVIRIMSVLPWNYDPSGDFNKLNIAGAARWSLRSNVQQHPKVRQLCLKARETKPELRKALDQVLGTTAGTTQQAVTRTAQ